MATHKGFGCDGCNASPIIGTRYTKTSANYDLCPKCYAKVEEKEKVKFTGVEKPPENNFQKLHWGAVALVFALMVRGSFACSGSAAADPSVHVPHELAGSAN